MFLDNQNGLNMHQNSLLLFKRKSVASYLGYVLGQPRNAACIKTACNSSSENPLQAIWAMFWGSQGAQHAPKQRATDVRLKAKKPCNVLGHVLRAAPNRFLLKSEHPL